MGGKATATPWRWTALLLAVALGGMALAWVTLGLPYWSIHTDNNPWTIDGREYHFQATDLFLPGPDYRTVCSVNDSSMPGWGPICTATGSAGFTGPYSDPLGPETHIQVLAQTLSFLILAIGTVSAAAIAAAVVRAIAPWDRSDGSRRRLGLVVSALLLAAGLLAVSTALYVMVEQPLAFNADSAKLGRFPGCGNTFWGSCAMNVGNSTNGVNSTETWGPATGWYLLLISGGLMLGAVGLSLRVWRRVDNQHTMSEPRLA